MIVAILAMQALALIALAVLGWRVVLTGRAVERMRPPLPQGVCQVLKRDGSRWKHHGWVRADSAAWREAHDTPDFALRDDKGELIEGVQ